MEISGLIAKIGVDLTEFERGIAKMQSRLEDTASKMATVGKKMSLMLTAPIVAMGAATTKVGMDFEAAMSEVAAISGATGEELGLLTEKAKEMGATTKFSASESAEALKYMAMAGWDTQQMLDGISGVMALAAASGENLGTVSDIVTDAITAFGMEAAQAGEFADVLAAASSNANTNVSMLGESFKYVAPVFGALGYSAEDAALALGLMANAGIKGSQAGTALRSALIRLSNPTGEAVGLIQKLGIQLTDAQGNMLPFESVMQQLRTTFQNLTTEQQAQYAATIFGQQSMSGMLAIINASEKDYQKLRSAINESTGAAKRMANEMQDNLSGRLTVLKSSIEGVALQLYDAMIPALESIVGAVQKAVNAFSNLNPSMQKTIVITAGIAAAVGPALLIGSQLLKMIKGIIPLITVLKTGFVNLQASIVAGTTGLKGFNLAFKMLGNLAKTNPFGLIATGLALIIPLLIKAFKGNKDLNAEISLTEKLQRDLNEEISQAAAGLEQEKVAINAAVKSIMEYNVGSKERILALEELKKKYPDYFKNIDAEKVTNAELSKILGNVNKSYEERIKLAQASAKVNVLTNKIVENQIKSEEALYKRQEAIAGMQKYWSKEVIEKFKQIAAETGKSLDLILYEEAQIISQGIGYRRNDKNELRSWIAQYEEANGVLVRSEEALKFYNEQLEKTINENIKNGDVIAKSNDIYRENTNVITTETDKQISIWQEYYSNLSTIYANLSNENLKFGADNLDFLIKTRDDIKNETNKQIEDWQKFLLTKKNLSKKEIDEINKYITDSGALTLEILKKLDTEIAAAMPVEKREIKGGIITIDTSYLDEYIAKQNELKKAFTDGKISYEQYIKAISDGNVDLDAMITKNRMIADTMNYLKNAANNTFMTLAEGMGAAMTGAAVFGKVFLNTIFDVIKGLLQLAASYLIEAIFEKQSKLYASLGPPGIVLLLATAGAAIAGISALQSQIMGLAEGGLVTKGGAFVVGERGREIVTLPAGSAVTPISKMAKNNFYLDGELRARVRGEDLEFVLNRVEFKNRKR